MHLLCWMPLEKDWRYKTVPPRVYGFLGKMTYEFEGKKQTGEKRENRKGKGGGEGKNECA